MVPQDEVRRRALDAANGHDVFRERATWAAVLAALVLMVLLVVRMVAG